MAKPSGRGPRAAQRLFVYGTLRSDSPGSRFGLIGPAAEFLARGRMRGRLVDLGPYPGMIPPRGEDEWVRGEVYVLRDPAALLARLDAYEGCAAHSRRPHLYRRVPGEACLDDGQWVGVWAYEYQGPLQGGRIIPSGDYVDTGETSCPE